MAGAGYKLYNTGDVLTAADVNTYLQQQTVMVFASSAARTSALSGVLAEGMLSYLTDTDLVQYYNGTAWTTINTDQTPLTTKGDLFTFSTTDARLAVGNNGETLVADSSTSTGLRWQASMSAGKNCIINGGMDIWQRGTSFTVASAIKTFAADRWMPFRSATGLTASRQSSGLAGFTYSLRMQRDSGNTSTTTIYLGQNVEILNSAPYIDKTVTLSFWARAGANYSAASSALGYQLTTGTNASDQDGFLSGYTGSATPISQTATLTTSWQRFSASGTISSTATQFYVAFNTTPTGTAGANDWFEITGVQVELGSAATAFSRAGGNIAGELAACQRYYWRSTTSTQGSHGIGATQSTTSAIVGVNLPVTMRVVPTSIDYANLRLVNYGVAAYAISAITLSTTESTQNFLNIDCSGATGMTANRPVFLYGTGSSGYLGASAEL